MQEPGAGGQDQRPEEIREFAEHVEKPEIFAGFVFGNQLAEIGTGQRLDAALADAHADRQNPEFRLRIQPVSEDTDPDVHEDENLDEPHGAVLFRQRSAQDGAGEGHELGQQQGQHHGVGIDPHLAAVGGGHGNDGANAVDVTEISEDEQEQPFVLRQLFQRLSEAAEGGGDHVILPGNGIFLMDVLIQGNGHRRPPHHGDHEGNPGGGGHGKAQGVAV